MRLSALQCGSRGRPDCCSATTGGQGVPAAVSQHPIGAIQCHYVGTPPLDRRRFAFIAEQRYLDLFGVLVAGAVVVGVPMSAVNGRVGPLGWQPNRP